MNRPIDRDEVKEAVFRSKLGKSVGVDEIPSEILRNDTCIDLLYKLIKLCFTEGHVPKEWLTSVISAIPKPNMDTLNPLAFAYLGSVQDICGYIKQKTYKITVVKELQSELFCHLSVQVN